MNKHLSENSQHGREKKGHASKQSDANRSSIVSLFPERRGKTSDIDAAPKRKECGWTKMSKDLNHATHLPQ
ncbi:hypothetical protein [Paenibacillus planticolens]|uniref:Uncharacterized protein n=1 Tax=Paenibacillus planticolens TaxID=2654976 RepID=A0ABX1ZXY9_9BACL|nr:hypothetical protein [Paenibacillus planticolens]NOV03847.1 hypothetical protein [Paenibacillus planticolens]